MAYITRATFVRPNTSVSFLPASLDETYRTDSNTRMTNHGITMTSSYSADNLTFTLEWTCPNEAAWDDYQFEMANAWTDAGFLDHLEDNGVTLTNTVIENT